MSTLNTTSFHNVTFENSTDFEIWIGKIPPHAENVTISYYIYVGEGGFDAYLKAGTDGVTPNVVQNQFGQWIWNMEISGYFYNFTISPSPPKTQSSDHPKISDGVWILIFVIVIVGVLCCALVTGTLILRSKRSRWKKIQTNVDEKRFLLHLGK